MSDMPPVPEDAGRKLALAVRALDIEYRALRNRFCAGAGISPAELDALALVAGRPNITPKDLAAVTYLTTSATTALIDRLATAGYLQRTPHPHDRRSIVVQLTDRGERLTSDLSRRYISKFEKLASTDAISERTLRAMLAGLQSFTEALASEQGESEVEANSRLDPSRPIPSQNRATA